MVKPLQKLRLHGFNNLTKSLSFNIYDICYAKTERQRDGYIAYIDETYDSDRLAQILSTVAHIIDANILAISRQDYDPQGASVTMLISEEPVVSPTHVSSMDSESPGPLPSEPIVTPDLPNALRPSQGADTTVAHLDKSHITVHTYPESHPDNGISTFRADIDVSTCGRISPLKALAYLLDCFDSEIVTVDYRVRGFTRDVKGKKYFIDHKINSIQNFIPASVRERYQLIDVNVYQENLFHTKMLLRDIDLGNHLFGVDADALKPAHREQIESRLRREMLEIFYGRNMRRSPPRGTKALLPPDRT